jgi:hypothetical protein
MDKLCYVYVYYDETEVFEPLVIFDVVFSHKPFYIGMGSGDRIEDHIKDARNKSLHSHKLYKIRHLQELLKRDPKYEILKSCMTREEAYSLEYNLIKYFGKQVDNSGILTNVIDGGISNPILYGPSNGFYGKTHTTETKEKIVSKYKQWYYSLSEDERRNINEKKGEITKKRWDSLSELEKEEHIKKRSEVRLKNKLKKDPSYIPKHITNLQKKQITQQKREEARKIKKIQESCTIKLKYLNEEELKDYYKETRGGENNGNYGNGDKISGKRNPRAKIFKIEIKGYIFILHGNKRQFGKDFKMFFNTNDPTRSGEGFTKKYGLKITEIENQLMYPSNYIIYNDISSFKELEHEHFVKCKSS